MPSIMCVESKMEYDARNSRALEIKRTGARKTIKAFLDWYLVNGKYDFDTELERYLQEVIV